MGGGTRGSIWVVATFGRERGPKASAGPPTPSGERKRTEPTTGLRTRPGRWTGPQVGKKKRINENISKLINKCGIKWEYEKKLTKNTKSRVYYFVGEKN